MAGKEVHSELYQASSSVFDGTFCESSQHFLAVKYIRTKSISKMFDWIYTGVCHKIRIRFV